MKDFISSQNNNKFMEKNPVENSTQRKNELTGKDANNLPMNEEYDLKLDDSASEDLK